MADSTSPPRDAAPPSPAAATGGPVDTVLALTIMLAAVSSIGPFAVQAIAPGLPAIGRALEVSPAAAQLLVSLAVFAMAAGAIVYGPLADHFGRRPVLLGGLALTVLGATIAALAPVFEVVLLGRVLQSVGAGAGMVLARAVARDLFGQDGAAAMIARITGFMVIAPMVAPVIGGVLIEGVGWRGLFAAIACFALGLLFWARARFQETLVSPSPGVDLGAVLRDYRMILARPAFRAHAAFATLSISTFFLFVGAAPYVMEQSFGLGPASYGALFIAISVTYMAANFSAAWAARRWGARRLILRGPPLFAIGGLPLAAALAMGVGGAGWGGAALLAFVCAVNAVSAGWSQPQALAGAVSAAPERAGSASGLTAVLMFTGAGVAAQAATLLPPLSPGVLPIAMSVMAVLSSVLFWLLAPRPVP